MISKKKFRKILCKWKDTPKHNHKLQLALYSSLIPKDKTNA